MTTKTQPDGLPFARIVRFGLPFHGFVRSGALTLPDSSTMTYPQPSGTSLTYVKHPLAETPTRTPEEIAWETTRNYQWLDYAYVSGAWSAIGGTDLNVTHDTAHQYWLYCSATKTWLIRAVLSKGATAMTVTVAAKRFGQFKIPENVAAQVFTTIGTYSFPILKYDNVNITGLGGERFVYMGTTHKRDGSVTVMNFRHIAYSEEYFAASFNFCGAIKLTLSGDDADELAVSGANLCLGSSIATVTEFSAAETSHIGITVFDGGAWTYTTYDPFYTWENETVTEHVQDYRPLLYCYGASIISFDSEGTPTSITYGSSYAADIKYYYFVTPSGVVGSVESNYTNKLLTTDDLDVGWSSESGWAEYDANTDTENSSTPVSITSTSTGTFSKGTSFYVGITGASLYDASEVYDEYSIGYYSGSLSWTRPCSATDVGGLVNMSHTGSTTYSTNVDGVTTEYEESLSFTQKTARLSLLNNNIIDMWRDYTGNTTYAGSITIFGERFSRKVGDNLVNAIVDPRTETVHLAASGQTISIV